MLTAMMLESGDERRHSMFDTARMIGGGVQASTIAHGGKDFRGPLCTAAQADSSVGRVGTWSIPGARWVGSGTRKRSPTRVGSCTGIRELQGHI